jgi:hypothetical protein
MITDERKSQLVKYAVFTFLEASGEVDGHIGFTSTYAPQNDEEQEYLKEQRQTTIKDIVTELRSNAKRGEQITEETFEHAQSWKKHLEHCRQGGLARLEGEKSIYDKEKYIKRIRRIMADNKFISFTEARRLSVKDAIPSEAWAKKHIQKKDI